MTTAERLSKIDEGIEKTKSLNAELEQTLYGTDTGGKSFYDEFWDTNLQNGNRTNFDSAYMTGAWTKKNFKPNHDIRPSGLTSANRMFFQFGIGDSEMLDMVELAEQQGIVFDYSQAREFSATFSSCTIGRLGTIDMRNATKCNNTFYQYKPFGLETIEKIISAEKTPWQSTSFGYANNLKEVRFEGTIGQNGLNFQWSTKLSKASWVSIVGCYSTTISGLSMTGSLVSVNSAFETSEGANDGSTSAEWLNLIATRPNVSFNLV